MYWKLQRPSAPGGCVRDGWVRHMRGGLIEKILLRRFPLIWQVCAWVRRHRLLAEDVP